MSDTLILPRLPELLAPAGSPDALEAALGAGADAVYLGGSAFNARMNAHNFDAGELKEAVTTAHRLGGRVYLTLNTLIYDRELPAALRAAYEAALCGVDGLIIADTGAAALIHEALPSLPLHASTQLSGHNSRTGEVLAPFGFSRFVIARETRLEDLRAAVAGSPLEIEVFIHGALCVCHSGQCLFSSLVGGRSGNRGECAQPCRLPYGSASAGSSRAQASRADDRRPGGNARRDPRRDPSPAAQKEDYPLSLKDLSLAAHVPELIASGAASLKIEGRMKSAGYVGGVTAIWRRLLDERRAATEDELQKLSDLFSRGGFTDGYFIGRVDHRMTGIRSEDDKERSAAAEKAAAAARAGSFLPASLSASVKAGMPLTLTASAPLFRQEERPSGEGEGENKKTVTVTVLGDVPEEAQNPSAALTSGTLVKQLSKLGGTPYTAASVRVDCEEGLILPLARLNALRRQATDALDAARMAAMPAPASPYTPEKALLPGRALSGSDGMPSAEPSGRQEPPGGAMMRYAHFLRPEQITPAAAGYFKVRFLPLDRWEPSANGVSLPPVIFDHESEEVKASLARVLRAGARHILIGNVGHFPLLCEVCAALESSLTAGLTLHGDFRLNLTNAAALARVFEMAAASGAPLSDVILSPELTLPRLRDLCAAHPDQAGVIIYGRLPLMLLEKCVIRELYPDSRDPKKQNGRAGAACAACASDAAALSDRKGVVFPLLRIAGHRNLLLNALPLSMTDRPDDLSRAGISLRHYLFTTESPAAVDRVIRADREGAAVGGEVRRIK